MDRNSTWTPKVMKRLLELHTEREMGNTDLSESKMASILNDEFNPGLNITKDAVHGKLWREIPNMVMTPVECIFMPTYEKYKGEIQNSAIKKSLTVDLSGKKKILHLCDLHIPFENKDALYAALNLGASADIVVMSEIMDISSYSPFDDAKVPLELEIESTLKFLEFMSNAFPRIIILESNHERRIKRAVLHRLPTDLQFMVEETNILELLTRPFPNIYVLPHWWIQLGDSLFCHADKSSSVSMKTAIELAEYFNVYWKTFGIRMPYHVLVQSHTHAMGVSHRPDLKIFEGGCLCQFLNWYISKPSKTAWTTGFVVVEMNNGVSDLNKAREFVLENRTQLEQVRVVF